MSEKLKPALPAILEEVDFSELFTTADEGDDELVAFWLPKPYHKKYHSLQGRSKKKFGKLVKQVIMICIDRADTEEPKAS